MSCINNWAGKCVQRDPFITALFLEEDSRLGPSPIPLALGLPGQDIVAEAGGGG